MSNDLTIESPRWYNAGIAFPTPKKEVSVRGADTQGGWTITGGVWWQPYKGQSSTQGRWMCKDGAGKAMRLPESEDVDQWSYV